MENTVTLAPAEELAGLSSQAIADKLAALEAEQEDRRKAGSYAEAAAIGEHRLALLDAAPPFIAAAALREDEEALFKLEVKLGFAQTGSLEAAKRENEKITFLEEETRRLKVDIESAHFAAIVASNHVRELREEIEHKKGEIFEKRFALEAAEAGKTVEEMKQARLQDGEAETRSYEAQVRREKKRRAEELDRE